MAAQQQLIDKFTVMHKGGTILYSKEVCPLKGDPINDLVRTVLLEERASDKAFKKDTYELRWSLVNEFDLVFVIVYSQAVSMMWLDELLETLKSAFVGMFRSRFASVPLGVEKFEFERDLKAILARHEQDCEVRKKKGQKAFDDTKLAADIRTPEQKREAEAVRAEKEKARATVEEAEEGDSAEKDSPSGMASRGAKGARVQRGFVPKSKAGKGDAASPAKKKRDWDPLTAGNEPGGDDLDRSTDKPTNGSIFLDERDTRALMGDGVANVDDWEVDSEDEDAAPADGGAKKKGIFSYLSNLTGTRELTREDLLPVLGDFKELLVSKNVAMEIAEKLCESVGEGLMGRKIRGFNGVKKAVKEALEEALSRILTPKQSMDVLREVKECKAKGRPYVVVFVGVNGVGKSTSLSKICFYLKGQGLKVLLAACDTFRSGAVEQLKTHAARLDVPVYEKGYNKDAASIAHDSIKYAAQNGFDVVLVDTAGRMQDNEPLMRALSKLVNLNTPDLVLFVGEALVGNDSIDQVTKFNQALKESAYGSGEPRLIDGIMLTKFDTIDDKVGAAVSMVYSTGQPVIFVGVGQTYADLKKLNVSNIVKLLLR